MAKSTLRSLEVKLNKLQKKNDEIKAKKDLMAKLEAEKKRTESLKRAATKKRR